PDYTGRVCNPVRKHRRLRVEQQARRFACAGADHKRFGANSFFSASGLVDIGNCFSFSIFADDNLPGHRAGDQSEAPGLLRWWNHHLAGAEIRSADTAAPTLAAVMTGRSSVVRLSDDGKP